MRKAKLTGLVIGFCTVASVVACGSKDTSPKRHDAAIGHDGPEGSGGSGGTDGIANTGGSAGGDGNFGTGGSGTGGAASTGGATGNDGSIGTGGSGTGGAVSTGGTTGTGGQPGTGGSGAGGTTSTLDSGAPKPDADAYDSQGKDAGSSVDGKPEVKCPPGLTADDYPGLFCSEDDLYQTTWACSVSGGCSCRPMLDDHCENGCEDSLDGNARCR